MRVPMRAATATALLFGLISALACAGAPAATPTPTSTLIQVVRPSVIASPQATEETTPSLSAAASPILIDSLCDLVMPAEVDEAIDDFVSGIDDRHAVGQPVELSGPGEASCTYETDSGASVRLEQGSPADFEPGALIDGVPGELVTALAADTDAAWFPADPPTLSVRRAGAYFRLLPNIPDEDNAARLDIAKSLAAIAVSRLP